MTLLLSLLPCAISQAQDKIKAVMYVGGGFHDYKKMPGYLAEKIGALANISFDIKHVDTPPRDGRRV